MAPDPQGWVKAVRAGDFLVLLFLNNCSGRWGNVVRLFCSMLTNIQAQMLCGVDLTDQPMLVHIWKLCCKCHRGQGCPASERHLLWVPQQGPLCFQGGFRWLLHRKLTHKGTQMSWWLDGVDRVGSNGTKEGGWQCFPLVFPVGTDSQQQSWGLSIFYCCLLPAMQVRLPWPAALQAARLVEPVSSWDVIQWSCWMQQRRKSSVF